MAKRTSADFQVKVKVVLSCSATESYAFRRALEVAVTGRILRATIVNAVLESPADSAILVAEKFALVCSLPAIKRGQIEAGNALPLESNVLAGRGVRRRVRRRAGGRAGGRVCRRVCGEWDTRVHATRAGDGIGVTPPPHTWSSCSSVRR